MRERSDDPRFTRPRRRSDAYHGCANYHNGRADYDYHGCANHHYGRADHDHVNVGSGSDPHLRRDGP